MASRRRDFPDRTVKSSIQYVVFSKYFFLCSLVLLLECGNLHHLASKKVITSGDDYDDVEEDYYYYNDYGDEEDLYDYAEYRSPTYSP